MNGQNMLAADEPTGARYREDVQLQPLNPIRLV